MKKQILAAALMAAALLTEGRAQSFTPVSNGSFSTGDILVGFSSATAGKNYVFDIGTDINLFSSLNVGADLTATFGTNWATAVPDLTWGVFGMNYNEYGDPVSTVASVATGAFAPDQLSSGQLGIGSSSYSSIINKLNFDSGFGRSLTYGTYQNNGNNGDSKGDNMWLGIADSDTPFSIYNEKIVASAESTAVTLDIYTTTATSSAKTTQLTLSSDGTVSAVPEPSTYALMGLGLLGLVIIARRQSNKA